MKKLFNIFKQEETLPQKNQTTQYTYTIGNRIYKVEDFTQFKVQSEADDVQIYGWTLETRYKHNGDWTDWFTYWNHRIYTSRHSALDAATKVFISSREGYEWRICPLYKMTQPQYREWKIDQLISDKNSEKKVAEIKVWKIKEDLEIDMNNGNKRIFKKGSLIIQKENGSYIEVQNQTDGLIGFWYSRILKEDFIPNGKVEEVDIQNEKWCHPHLCKELKTKIKK